MRALCWFISILVGLLVVLALGFGTWWIVSAPKASGNGSTPHASASVKVVKEDDLGLVKLTPEALQRLGVRVDPVCRQTVKRMRTYGGEITVPAGRTILVASPLAGTLQSPSEGVPQVGAFVKRGQTIFQLSPLLSPEATTTFAAARADAEGQVNSAKTQTVGLKLALDRAQRLFRDDAGSRRAVEEAQAQYDVSLRSLEAAELRLKVLTQAVGDAATGRSTPIAIESPADGLLRNLSVSAGQSVPVSGALFEVVALTEVWVRVPIYVGDLDSIDANADADVGSLNAAAGKPTIAATPVQAPPTATPSAATVDLYYLLNNSGGQYIPGQLVGVTLSLRQEAESLTVPWGAVVHDLQGGTWVYEEKSAGAYKRQRVQVRFVTNGLAVLATGPVPGSKIVTEGAIELFGVETGYSK